jgi:hypothetical protein
MRNAKRSIQSAVTIDGIAIAWHLHREQQSSTEDGMLGIAIHAEVMGGKRRELHLEYPTFETRTVGYRRTDPARPTIVAAKVVAHIREAMAAGWDPDSRGKPFVYHVSGLPN